MPRHLSAEELHNLEEWLREGLVPVTPDPQFVDRTQSRLQDPRAVQVPMKGPVTLGQSLWLIASLSGALMALAMVVVWLFWRRGQARQVAG